jgi:hypothetical protein
VSYSTQEVPRQVASGRSVSLTTWSLPLTPFAHLPQEWVSISAHTDPLLLGPKHARSMPRRDFA